MSSVAHKDNNRNPLKHTYWPDWLLAGWAVTIFAFFLRSVIEMLS